MTRKMLLASALLALSAASAQAATATWLSGIADDGWRRTGADNDAVTFTRGERVGQGAPRQWYRVEVRNARPAGTFEWKSMMGLDEYDCSGGRVRTLQANFYVLNNMKGDSISTKTPSEWVYPQPGSAAEFRHNAVCGVRRAG